MKNDTIIELMEGLKGQCDFENPPRGHQQRFIEKLEIQNNGPLVQRKRSFGNIKTVLSIAASLVLFISIINHFANAPKSNDLGSVSTEMSTTEDFFVTTLEAELKKINKERTPMTEPIISDAMAQIQMLEENYEKLKLDLEESGEDQRVIYAMITNFQTRIDLLYSVLEQIELLKQLNTISHETNNTI